MATIHNVGSVPQPAGSTVTLEAERGLIGDLPPECNVTESGDVVCTAGELGRGKKQDFTFTVTPTDGATSVLTSATGRAAASEFGVPPAEDGDFDSKLTQIAGVTLDLTNMPSEVRFGDDTLVTAAVRNAGPAQTVTLVISTGNRHDPAQTNLSPDCLVSGDGSTVTCTSAFTASQTRAFDVAVVSPTSGTEFVSSATATGSIAGSASDSVTTRLSDEAQAFVPEGGELTFEGEVTTTTFKVSDNSAPGLALDLNEITLAPDTPCGTQPCYQKAAEALFDNDGTYSGSNPKYPFLWKITYTVDQTCDESGVRCLFNSIYYIPSGGTTAIPMPKCSTFARTGPPAEPVLDDVDQVCLNYVTWEAGTATYDVALLRDIVIPIIGGTTRRS